MNAQANKRPDSIGGSRPAGSTGRANHTPRYRADIGAGSLKVPESRIIADLLLRGVDAKSFNVEIADNNVLQARSAETAKRLASLLRARLELMQPTLWQMVRDGSTPLATDACLAAAVKHSALLGDFLDLVMRECYQLRRPVLSIPLWEHYVEDCHNRDPSMSNWSEATVSRMRSAVFAILAQAGYVENVRNLKLQTVHIDTAVLAHLRGEDEQYVLRCIEVGP